MRALRDYGRKANDLEIPPDYTELFYGNGFPDWFVIRAESHYEWDWKHILIDLRSTTFVYESPTHGSFGDSIIGEFLSESDASRLGEQVLQTLAALTTTLPTGQSVARSLELDGFGVNKEKLSLVTLEGPVSAQEEEDALTGLVKGSGLPNGSTILKHIGDTHGLYADGKNHPSINESRNFVQAIVDGISTETDKHGKHKLGFPGGTANRMKYLKDVGFLTGDEETALGSAWGSLSAGSHPGVPEREQARIGLVLALEFGQLLLLKFANWRANAYRAFS